MSARRYVQVGYPWAAAFEAGQPAPVTYLAGLIGQTLRYGMPARRYGPAGAWVVRHAVGERVLRTALAARRPKERPDIDRLLEEVAGAWERLEVRHPHLPDRVPARLTALSLKRRAADTVFVFGDGPAPLLVCKTPRGEPSTLETEVTALEEALPADIAPRPLGKVGDAFVQEALAGAPLEVEPVTPSNARELGWRAEYEMLGDALVRLAETTARPGPPQELRSGVKEALETADLAPATKRTALAALEDLEKFDKAVLRHGDTSAQNCLFHNGRLTGLVDWEIARPQGAPGFDILNAAVALIDHGVGLVRWSEERAVESFRNAWKRSAFFEEARKAARRASDAAGGSAADHERLEIAFFARRLASRAASPASYATGPNSAARMLEVVCAP